MISKMKNLIFVVPFLLLYACKEEEESIFPIKEDISESVYASGMLKTMDQYQVFPSVSGSLKKIYVQEGDTVKAGDTLFAIANDLSRLNTENAQLAADYAAYSANTSKLSELKNNIDIAREKMHSDSMLFYRQKNLWSQQIGSKTELEQRELAYNNSVMQYRSAVLRYNDLNKQISFTSRQSKKNLEISKKAESDFIIRSEINGRVYSVLKNKGEMAGPQSPLAVIGDADDFIIELQVDEYDIVRVKKGQLVLISMDSYKGQTFEALIHKIDPIMNERSRTFTVEAVFTQRPEILYPHLSLEANILISTKKNVLTIPRNCLLDDQYVILKNGEKVKLEIGLMDFKKAEVLSGITEKDAIRIPVQ